MKGNSTAWATRLSGATGNRLDKREALCRFELTAWRRRSSVALQAVEPFLARPEMALREQWSARFEPLSRLELREASRKCAFGGTMVGAF